MSTQWLSLVAAMWLQSISATNTNFPAYSSQLKSLLSISQLQLNNLAFASDAGKILACFSGLAAAHLPLWLTLFIGSVIGFIAYGAQYIMLDLLTSPPYSVFFILSIVAGNSICWINTVCYILIIQNFPLDMQLSLGLSTSYQGLSAKIYGDIVEVVYKNSSASEKARGYLLLNSVLPFIVCIIVAPLVARSCGNIGDRGSSGCGSFYTCSRKLSTGFVVMFLITTATGIFAVISTSLGDSILTSSANIPLIVLIGIGVLVIFFPITVPLAEKIRENVQHKCWIRQRRVRSFPADEQVENGNQGLALSVETGAVQHGDKNAVQVDEQETGSWLMIKKLDFWIYFFVYMFGATIGLVYLNNLGQIVESRGHSRTTSLVSLSSSFSFFGRLIPCLLEYCFTRARYMSSRAGEMAVMMAPMTGAFFILLIDSNICLHISTAIIGLSTGAISSIAVSATRELFGAKRFGVNHNIVIINIPIGSIVFGSLAAMLYRRNGGFDDDGKCMGMKCYNTSFIVWGSLCCLGTLLAVMLHSRTRKFCSYVN
ncbi:hypothetical protein ACET3Z_028451 [Daucus carota]